MASVKLKLKLVIDTKAQKVIFAEAGKDFVDFLLYLLSLHLGTVVRLLNKKSMVGCLGSLYESIEKLNGNYMQPSKNRKSVLYPTASISTTGIPLLLPANESPIPTPTSTYSYGCKVHGFISKVSDLLCPSCDKKMTHMYSKVVNPPPASTEGGFVKGMVSYMVMDHLEFIPMSTNNFITMLNKYNAKEVGAIEERVVDFGVAEGLKLLKLSLECKEILTSIYLEKIAGAEKSKAVQDSKPSC